MNAMSHPFGILDAERASPWVLAISGLPESEASSCSCTTTSSFDNHYQWLDSPDQVKEQIELFLSDTCEDLGWKSFSELRKGSTSLKDLAPMFGKNWTAEEIIRAIEEDEYLIISILEEHLGIPRTSTIRRDRCDPKQLSKETSHWRLVQCWNMLSTQQK